MGRARGRKGLLKGLGGDAGRHKGGSCPSGRVAEQLISISAASFHRQRLFFQPSNLVWLGRKVFFYDTLFFSMYIIHMMCIYPSQDFNAMTDCSISSFSMGNGIGRGDSGIITSSLAGTT